MGLAYLLGILSIVSQSFSENSALVSLAWIVLMLCCGRSSKLYLYVCLRLAGLFSPDDRFETDQRSFFSYCGETACVWRDFLGVLSLTFDWCRIVELLKFNCVL